MKLILTRPVKDAEPLAAKLRALGHESVILPLLDIVPRPGISIPGLPWQAVCITSANGLANAEAIAGLRHVPVLCVGPQSAAAAERAGFTNVRAEGGDVDGLAAYIAAHVKQKDGPILYLSGAATSGDLEGRLRTAGFAVERIVTYDAVQTTPDDLARAVTDADAVLLYSPRTAKLWVEQVEKAGAAQHMAAMVHLCLSPAVARALPEAWPRHIANAPDEAAMLAALQTLEPPSEQE